ncbi:MAG: hcpA 1 [Rickettsiales bacterium]|nr:hcpA 1 [Rickettsiales bacterium]
MGAFYNRGVGVQKDLKEARKWYQKAAEQEFAEAMFNLGMLSATDAGESKNYLEAYKWFYLAVQEGSNLRYTNARDAVAKEMTSEQIASSKKLAESWLAKHSTK